MLASQDGTLARAVWYLPIRSPPTTCFLQLLIPGGFKSNDFVTAHVKGLAVAFFVSVHCKRLAELNEHSDICSSEEP